MSHPKDKKKQGLLGAILEFAFLLSIVFLIRTFGFGLYQVPTGSMETTMLVGERFFADKLSYVFRDPNRYEVISMNDPVYKYSKNKMTHLWEHYVWGPSNWTKRVIGLPGDTVRGVIEDGKPIVYLNGTKTDGSYLNKHPLLHVFKTDPRVVQKELEQKLRSQGVDVSRLNEAAMARVLGMHLSEQTCWISYDPAQPYDKQPFYGTHVDRVINGPDGKPEMRWPATPQYAREGEPRSTSGNYWGSDEFNITLGSDEYWLMGDNRMGSYDSRWFGPVKRELIHGRIIFRIWSIDSHESWWILDLIKHPVEFWSRVRWARFFQWVQ